MKVFFDTYAFFELIKGNEAYKKFEEGYSIITTKLNLMELYYGLLIQSNEEVASYFYDYFLKSSIGFDDETIKEAMKFRAINKKGDLSYIDCLGYIQALKSNIRFVTGDKDFKELPNVEFLK